MRNGERKNSKTKGLLQTIGSLLILLALALGTAFALAEWADYRMRQPGDGADAGPGLGPFAAAGTECLLGKLAPDFTLFPPDRRNQITLSAFRGKRPVVLLFGSYSWDLFRDQFGPLQALWKKYGDRLEFYTIYVREAHPGEEGTDGVHMEQPKTFAQRAANAEAMCRERELSIPMLIDTPDDAVAADYRAFPLRAFLIGKDGCVEYGTPLLHMTVQQLEYAIKRQPLESPLKTAR